MKKEIFSIIILIATYLILQAIVPSGTTFFIHLGRLFMFQSYLETSMIEFCFFIIILQLPLLIFSFVICYFGKYQNQSTRSMTQCYMTGVGLYCFIMLLLINFLSLLNVIIGMFYTDMLLFNFNEINTLFLFLCGTSAIVFINENNALKNAHGLDTIIINLLKNNKKHMGIIFASTFVLITLEIFLIIRMFCFKQIIPVISSFLIAGGACWIYHVNYEYGTAEVVTDPNWYNE